MAEFIIVSDDGPIRTVRMNRPDKKNALNVAMYNALAAALESAAGAADLRCIVIAGARGAFCAGNDLQDFLHAVEDREGLSSPQLRFLHALARNEKPLVAAVGGLAVGIGTTMLLHCDHVVAATDAVFSTPFVNLGLAPEAASSLLAPQRMGHARAFSLLAMGRPLDAAAAQTAGIVNTLVAAPEVDAEAHKAALQIASLPAEAL
ncbi:MAG TPA: enoyl-CoA hydratase-related protein, partial [Xanthobacteraceae bacterium]